MWQRAQALLVDRKGISSLEYAVMAIGVVGAVFLGAKTLGADIQALLAGLVATVTAS